MAEGPGHKCHFRRVNICTTREKYAQRVKNTVRLDKTWQLHQRCHICNVAKRERKQTKRAVFYSFYSYALLPFISTLRRVNSTWRRVKFYSDVLESYFDESSSQLGDESNFTVTY